MAKTKNGAGTIKTLEEKSWAIFYQDGSYGIYCLTSGFPSREAAEQYAAQNTNGRAGLHGYGIAEMIGVVKPVAQPYKFIELE